MSAPDPKQTALAEVGSIPRDIDRPAFPAPWAARAFALAVALNERGVFAWSEWSALLGRKVAAVSPAELSDPEAYWRAWLEALEDMLATKNVAAPAQLKDLSEAWRRAAKTTPHGEPIELSRQA